MGAVYQATDRLQQTQVALKQVRLPDANYNAQRTPETNHAKLALAQEFRALASLQHPHIISVLDYGFAQNSTPFFTMPLLQDAQPITQWAQDKTQEDTIQLLMQLLEALTYLHQRGIIHRDIKPANILVSDGQVYVLDFGLALSQTQQQSVGGTLAYMAPEVLQGATTSTASDQFALGLIAYEMLTGRYPFSKHPARMIASIVQQQPDFSTLPPALAPIVAKLMAKQPQERFDDIWTAKRAFAQATEQDHDETATRESLLQTATFVGRDDELAQLTQALEDLSEGNGSAWLIGGESGVGKTRLFNEVRIRALVEGIAVWRGQAIADGGHRYALWQDIVRQVLLHITPTTREVSILQAILPDISTYTGIATQDLPTLDAQAEQERLASVLAGCIARIKQPTLIMLEDLQWAGDSLFLLNWLTRLQDDLTLLIIANYRDDEAPTLSDDLPTMHHMALARLQDDAIQLLSQAILGENARHPQVQDFLTRQTEGNAFFLIEVMRALAEDAGSLQNIGQSTLPQSIITGGIQRVVQKRLAQIPEDLHPLLAHSAIIGRVLDMPLLAEHHNSQRIEAWLHQGVNSAILEKQGDMWQFAHDKLREQVLADMDTTIARHWHTLTAQSIEALHADALKTQIERLAHHWQGAGNDERFAHYGLQLAERYHHNNANQPLLTLANALRAILPAHSVNVGQVAHWQGEAHFSQGAWQEAQACYDEAMAIAQTHHMLALQGEVHIGMARLAIQQGDMDGALSHMEQAIQHTQDKPATYAYALTFLAALLQFRNELDQALAYQNEALEISQRVQAYHVTIGILNDRGVRANQLAQFAQAETDLRHSLALAQEAIAPRASAVIYDNLCYVAINQGRYEQAHSEARTGIAIAERIGEHFMLTSLLLRAGWSCACLGDSTLAKRYLHRALRDVEALGARNRRANITLILGGIETYEGNDADAQHYLEQSLADAQAYNTTWFVSQTQTMLANFALAQNDHTSALTYVQDALRDLQHEPIIENKLQSKLGFVLALMGDEQARPTLERVLKQTHQQAHTPFVLDALLGIALLNINQNPLRSRGIVALVGKHPAFSHLDSSVALGIVQTQQNEAGLGQLLASTVPRWDTLDDLVRDVLGKL
jgi:tetratricopeptide (TPR) repeat protein